VFRPSERLLKQLLSLRRFIAGEHSNLKVTQGDVRDVALRNSAESFSKHIFLLGVIARAWPEDRTQSLFAAVGIARQDQFRFVRSVINACDRALITDLHFQLEHMACSLARRVSKADSRTLFNAANVLIRRLHPLISEAGVGRLARPFRVASSIRNCLHNNGVHANRSFQATVGGYRYTFKKNQVVFYGLSSFLTVIDLAWKECAFWFSTAELRQLRVMDKFAVDYGMKLHAFLKYISATSVEMEELFARLSHKTNNAEQPGKVK